MRVAIRTLKGNFARRESDEKKRLEKSGKERAAAEAAQGKMKKKQTEEAIKKTAIYSELFSVDPNADSLTSLYTCSDDASAAGKDLNRPWAVRASKAVDAMLK
eukprot:15458079-Alexandrium_andersonii.AAC.1